MGSMIFFFLYCRHYKCNSMTTANQLSLRKSAFFLTTLVKQMSLGINHLLFNL